MTIRYRIKKRLFRAPLVVVQIHETRNHAATDGRDIESWQSEHWRDARIEDLRAKTPEGVVLT